MFKNSKSVSHTPKTPAGPKGKDGGNVAGGRFYGANLVDSTLPGGGKGTRAQGKHGANLADAPYHAAVNFPDNSGLAAGLGSADQTMKSKGNA